MKRAIVIAALAALILAAVSIWLGLSPTASTAFALDLFVASGIIASIAVFLCSVSAIYLERRVWIFAFSVLLIFLPIVPVVGQLARISGSPNGPFCAQNLGGAGVMEISCPSLWVSIMEFAWVLAPAIIVLMYAFWPHKQNAIVAIGQRT